ncbi:MAG: DegT/DnrJ/EryC1/StrS family aminotransferase [Candidatus Gastranaerophilales bacterium]|nr:DegT/DnrJ/EryC1/StrS family aminotransferase [Candidatus Gastranaerophilales bacterium]
MTDNSEKIFVTQPLLPKIEDYEIQLKKIWESKWLTNMGEQHNLLEKSLQNVLKVSNVSLFNNGTIALLSAIKSLDLPYQSEVITTPFTFAATPHCIAWNGLKPVFCDIEPNTMTIDADKIEKMITPNTSAIVAVHVYGFPCDIEKIDKIAKKHNLKVIYDAAHAFSTEIDGVGIGNFGDITMFSFHATKLFNTIEGGCLTYKNPEMSKVIYNLRNFGIQSEELVEAIGINGKMNEFQAAMGLENLKIYKKEQEKRKIVKNFYDKNLTGIKGIRIPQMPNNTTNSYQYYPIVIEDDYPLDRDMLYENFKSINIMTRKYFYPACTDYECYKHDLSVKLTDLSVVNDLKNKVLCLPFYGDLTEPILAIICEKIRNY